MRVAQTITRCVLTCLVSCSAPATKAASSPVQRYQLHGQIVQLDVSHQVARDPAPEDQSWVEAMTMEFPVKDESEFQAIHTGDQIAATVFVQDTDWWVGEIHQELVK
jgi:Cu/Ag efflux protein CusF